MDLDVDVDVDDPGQQRDRRLRVRATPRLAQLAAGALLVAGAAVCLGGAAAQSVPIGRYAEVAIGGAGAHPYRMSGVDARRSGRTGVRVAEQPQRRWLKRLSHRRLTAPAVLADGGLAVGSAGGVHALDAEGEQRWFAGVGPVRFTPTITARGELLVVTVSGGLHLVDAHGRARQLADNLPLIGSPLLLESGAVVVGGRDGNAHVLDLDGTRVASIPTAQREVLWLARVGEGLIVAAGRGQTLSLLSVHAGHVRDIRLSQRLATSPSVARDGTIWVLGEHGTLWGIAPSGRVRASVELEGVGPSLSLGRDGGVRVGVAPGEVLCLGANGAERWRRGVDGRPGAMLLDADDSVLFVTARGTLYAIADDGELRFRQSLGVGGAGRPVLGADGTIYIVSQSGQIQAWR